MQQRHFSKVDISILIGNALDHFDTALYGFLAPILAPLFFPNHDPVVQLILAYSILGTSVVTHPLGALVFGHMARSRGPAAGLSLSLMGVAMMTMVIGCLPTYDQVGCWAPINLIIVRMMLGIFAAGESTIARLYMLEEKPDKRAYHASSYFETSSVAGLILASCAVTAITSAYTPESYWRIPFLCGGVTAGVGIYLRKTLRHSEAPAIGEAFPDTFFNSVGLLWKEKVTLVRLSVVTSLSYVTYAIPFVFMNSFVPLVTAISFHEMVALNTFLLGFDMVAIPVIGRMISSFQPRSVMNVASSILGLSSVALFWFLPNASFTYVSFIRIWIVVFGLMYLCALNLWLRGHYTQRISRIRAVERVASPMSIVDYVTEGESRWSTHPKLERRRVYQRPEKYLLVGIGGAIGSSVIGRNTTALALLLWHATGCVIAPACYILVVCGFALWGCSCQFSDGSSN